METNVLFLMQNPNVCNTRLRVKQDENISCKMATI